MKRFLVSAAMLLFAMCWVMAQNEGFSKATVKVAKAVQKYKDKPEAKNEEKMQQVFQKSLTEDPSQAHYMWRCLGEAYYHTNIKDARKFDKGYECYTKALELTPESLGAERALCCYNLGLMYMKGHHVNQDFAKALELFSTCAESAPSLAAIAMASIYRYGLGVEKDEDKAYEFYLIAMRDGKDVFADTYSLAYNLTHQDTPEAEEANSLYDEAMKSIVLETKIETIASNLKKAADLGHAPAQTALAEYMQNYTYSLMFGVKGTIEEAELMAQKAASQDYPHGVYMLGRIIEISTFGKFMQWDRAKKYWECYKKAAELGHPVSQYVVGYIYSGENPNILSLIKEKANKTLAYEWFEKSAQAGWPNAKKKAEVYKSHAK